MNKVKVKESQHKKKYYRVYSRYYHLKHHIIKRVLKNHALTPDEQENP